MLAILAVMETYPLDQYALGLTAGILVPIWVIWLAMRAPGLWHSAVEEPVQADQLIHEA